MKIDRDNMALAMVFGAAIVAENEVWAAIFTVAAAILQYDKIEALLRR